MPRFFTLPPEGAPLGEPPIANYIRDPRTAPEMLDEFMLTQLPPLDEAGRDALRAATGSLAMTGTKPTVAMHSPTVEVGSWREAQSGRLIPIGTVTMISARKRGKPLA